MERIQIIRNLYLEGIIPASVALKLAKTDEEHQNVSDLINIIESS